MMRIIGIVLVVIGISGTVIFGIQAFSNSESFSILGLDIAVSHANWIPVIVSVVILVLGIVLSFNRKKASN